MRITFNYNCGSQSNLSVNMAKKLLYYSSKTLIFILILFMNINYLEAQTASVNKAEIQKDFDYLMQNISSHYAYLEEKKVDLECIKEKYGNQIEQLNNRSDLILFYEYILNEFYDSHISLNTNLYESYRLSAPIHVEIKGEKIFVKNVWQSQIENLDEDIIGAEVLTFNEIEFNSKIDDFPSYCNDKTSNEVRNWIANKLIAGKYNEQRILGLKLKDGKKVQFDLDKLKLKKEESLLSTTIDNKIGIIRINNSLGNNQLISEFDNGLDQLFDCKGIIIDLRNTNNGGNTYVAKGIMSRFIDTELPYQKHSYIESYDGQAKLVRSWLEMVSPRGKQYSKPIVVLVGRWTGSMGEGMAVGFDGMNRAEIVGTEMKRLAGSDFDFKFDYQNFGYKLILQRLYHIDGTPREKYIPEHYVSQTTTEKDEILEKGMAMILDMIK